MKLLNKMMSCFLILTLFAATVNAADLGITVTAGDVSIGDSGATITFVYGYTRKIVSISDL